MPVNNRQLKLKFAVLSGFQNGTIITNNDAQTVADCLALIHDHELIWSGLTCDFLSLL